MRPFFAVLLVGLVLLISAAVVGVATRSRRHDARVTRRFLFRLVCHPRQV